MRLVKCNWCKEKENKETMFAEEKVTEQLNKDGSPRITRKYFHNDCHSLYLQDKEQKEKELKALDQLYQYLIKLHNLDVLDGRMMEKIQDLRNGSIKVKAKKIKRYKEGVPYELMLDTYKFIEDRADYIKKTNEFKTEWNEFSYIFGTMVNNINAIKDAAVKRKTAERINKAIKINQETVEVQVKNSTKKDELDISDFL